MKLKKMLFGLVLLISLQSFYPIFCKEFMSNGTPIKLKTLQEINSNDHYVGEKLSFHVVEDVIVTDKKVLSKNATAQGTVVEISKNGLLGKVGLIKLTFDFVIADNGKKLPISGEYFIEGNKSTNEMVIFKTFFGLIGIFIKGQIATIPQGCNFTVNTLSDFEITDFPPIELTNDKASEISVEKGMFMKIITKNMTEISGLWEAKSDNKIHLREGNTITIIDISKIHTILDFENHIILDEVTKSADFEPSKPYKFNSLEVKEY